MFFMSIELQKYRPLPLEDPDLQPLALEELPFELTGMIAGFSDQESAASLATTSRSLKTTLAHFQPISTTQEVSAAKTDLLNEGWLSSKKKWWEPKMLVFRHLEDMRNISNAENLTEFQKILRKCLIIFTLVLITSALIAIGATLLGTPTSHILLLTIGVIFIKSLLSQIIYGLLRSLIDRISMAIKNKFYIKNFTHLLDKYTSLQARESSNVLDLTEAKRSLGNRIAMLVLKQDQRERRPELALRMLRAQAIFTAASQLIDTQLRRKGIQDVVFRQRCYREIIDGAKGSLGILNPTE